MSYNLPPDLEQRVRDYIATGHYADEADVLRDALKALEAQNADYAAIGAGIEDMEAGRIRSLTTVADDIRREQGCHSDA